MARRSLKIAALASTDITLGFAVQAAMLASVGVGSETDAYFAGQALPLVLLAILQMPLQRAVVSAYGGEITDRFPVVKLIVATCGSLAVLVGVLIAIGAVAIPLIYSGLPVDAQQTAVRVMALQGIAVTMTAANMILLSVNQLCGRFLQCELVVVAGAVISSAAAVLGVGEIGVIAVAASQVLKAGLVGAGYLWLLRGRLSWSSPPWAELLGIVRPLASAGFLSKLAPLVDRSIASAAPSGALTVLVFGQTLYGAAVTVAERSFVAPRLPALKLGLTRATVLPPALRLGAAGLAIGALLVGMLVLLQAVVPGLPDSRWAPFIHLLTVLTVLLVGFPIGTLAAQWLAASMVFVGKAHVSARVMAWCFLLSLPVKFLAFDLWGLQGVAVAMSCYYLASALSLYVILGRHFLSPFPNEGVR